MTKEELKELRIFDTKLKAKLSIDGNKNSYIFNMKETWVVTDMGYNLDDETLYVIQPLEMISGQEGFTGLWVYILKEEDLLYYFDLK